MRFGNKGQLDIKVIFIIVIVLVIMGIVSYVSMSDFFRQPQSYPQAWEHWADETFKDQEQPWRMLALFFLPFVFYFSVNYLAMSITYLGASTMYGRTQLNIIYKPVLLICFAISMMMLPSPFTFGLSAWFMGLSGVLPIFVIIFIAIGLPLTFIFIYAMGRRVHSHLQTYAPTRRREEEEREEAPRPPIRRRPRAREMPEPPEPPDLPNLQREILDLFGRANREIVDAIRNIVRI